MLTSLLFTALLSTTPTPEQNIQDNSTQLELIGRKQGRIRISGSELDSQLVGRKKGRIRISGSELDSQLVGRKKGRIRI